MHLTNEENKSIKTTVYIVEGEKESLLGKEDAIHPGIIKVNPRGEKLDKADQVGCITPEILQDPIKEGIVSGGQTQAQIDAKMDQLAEKHASIFQGMGRANTEPIHIEIRDHAIPVAQGRRPIPHSSERRHKRSSNTCWTTPSLKDRCQRRSAVVGSTTLW